MITTTLKAISQILNAKLTGEDGVIDSVSTDTRKINKGALFVALIGDRFDGHEFCQQAKDNGAGALLVSRPLPVNLPQIIVEDTKEALGTLASWVHKTCEIKTLAITGSCGKTTVKEMVFSILSQKTKLSQKAKLSQKNNVLATAGNFNNDIGVPLTLLRSEPQFDYAVIELGANHIGEIAYTTKLVKPTVALVNNVAAAHLEGFGSIDGVKKAKGEIYQGLAVGDTAIVNLDSHGGDIWTEVLADKKVMTFSESNSKANYYATNIELDSEGYASFTIHSNTGRYSEIDRHSEIDSYSEINTAPNSQPVKLSLVGRHNVANALAATALAVEFGASLSEVAQGLSCVVNAKGRSDITQLNKNITLIDDSYNASVPAMKAAVDLLSGYKEERWLILGYMAELGQQSAALHRQIAEYAAQFNFENVLTYGDDAKIISELCHGQHFSTHDKLINYIESQLQKAPQQAHTLLVKGANGARMSTVANALKEKHSCLFG